MNRQNANVDTSNMVKVSQQIPTSAPPISPMPDLNAFLVCPMPLVNAQPDNLRQFYKTGIPQMRVLFP